MNRLFRIILIVSAVYIQWIKKKTNKQKQCKIWKKKTNKTKNTTTFCLQLEIINISERVRRNNKKKRIIKEKITKRKIKTSKKQNNISRLFCYVLFYFISCCNSYIY